MRHVLTTLVASAALTFAASAVLAQETASDAETGTGEASPLSVLELPPAFGDGQISAEQYYDGGAIVGELAAQNLQTFDELDFEVFSNEEWERLHESHDEDIVVTWPDGHSTVGIDVHIEDLKALFVHAPDTEIMLHPIRIGAENWTASMGVMTGTFTEPMVGADGTAIEPTGNRFELPMATIAYWQDGRMVHEWLFWDNATYMAHLGL